MGISQQEALDLFNSDDLIGIGMAANEVRRKKTDGRIATYQIDRNINYTNFCTEYCSFCAFYRPLGAKDGYILPLESIYEKIEEMLELGGTGVLMQGGLHPDLRIEFYENMLRSIKERYPQVHLHCFSAPEITCIADVSGLTIAYIAYHKSLGGKPAPVINGLTGDQRFFLAFAQSWREKTREAATRAQVISDGHSPGNFRAQTVRNLDAWYDAFSPKPGEKLYLAPADRVKIW